MNVKQVSSNSQLDTEQFSYVEVTSDFPDSAIAVPRHATQISHSAIEPELALRYEPEAIAAYYSRRPFQVIGRIFAVLLPCFSFAFGLWWDKRWGQSLKKQQRRAVQLRELLTQLGPAYIKIGQALSTRPDLVPPGYLEELTQLQDQLPPFDNAIAYRFIQEELGQPPEEV